MIQVTCFMHMYSEMLVSGWKIVFCLLLSDYVIKSLHTFMGSNV